MPIFFLTLDLIIMIVETVYVLLQFFATCVSTLICMWKRFDIWASTLKYEGNIWPFDIWGWGCRKADKIFGSTPHLAFLILTRYEITHMCTTTCIIMTIDDGHHLHIFSFFSLLHRLLKPANSLANVFSVSWQSWHCTRSL